MIRKFFLAPLAAAALALPVNGEGADPAEPEIAPEDRAHWAFLPLDTGNIPGGFAAAENPVDAFIGAKLAETGLAFAPSADKATLLRRVTFDLTGLPPTLGEIREFLGDGSPAAYERVVDRLLASSRYGEHWAQHWLDVVRFAESDGFEFDQERPDAWRYRDWVISKLNEDASYAGFVTAQLAGDESTPPDPVATGFLMAGPDMVDINLPEERRHNFLNDMTATAGSVLLGLSVGCAQCHDHKREAFSIHDFYRLRAFFENTVVDPERSKQMPAVVAEPGAAAPASYVMVRGDFRRRGDLVEPAFPSVLDPQRIPIAPPAPGAESSSRRSALAAWIGRKGNALAYRVMANRIWQSHFGKGLVATPNDFGKGGERPTHPGLLDWLAAELQGEGAGFKSVHRVIVTSATYRQASHGPGVAESVSLDAANALYSRMPRRRLSGEAIRDAMLFASGRLLEETGGPGIRPPLPPEVKSTLLANQWNVTEDASQHDRRSVYLFVRRNLRFPMFDVFDRPDANASCPARGITTTAPQSLTLINSTFSRDCASDLAKRAAASRPKNDPMGRIAFIYQAVLSRTPSAEEAQRALDFINEQAARIESEGKSDPRLEAFADFCLALCNTSEAVYID